MSFMDVFSPFEQPLACPILKPGIKYLNVFTIALSSIEHNNQNTIS